MFPIFMMAVAVSPASADSDAIVALALAKAKRDRVQLSSDDSSKQSAQTSKVKVPAVGWHVHRCPNGHEFSHTDASFGSWQDHTCPICGQEAVKNAQGSWMPTERNTRIVEVSKPVVAVQGTQFQYVPQNSTCPNGNCTQSYQSSYSRPGLVGRLLGR